MDIRQRTWEIVEVAKTGDTASRTFDIAILTLIFLNVLVVVVGTVPAVHTRFSFHLWAFEVFSVAVFTVEYLARLWSCVENEKYGHPIWGRLRFALKPLLLVDLIAILPFYLPFLGIDMRFLRVLRMSRILRLFKVGRYYLSLQLIVRVLKGKKEELVVTTTIMVFLLVISSSLMFYCENQAQPEAFPSIPATMWWAVATLTTVGYGDVCPITPAGKLFASFTAILGIGMFALPTSLLGAGFVEEIQKNKQNRRMTCPHCGKQIEP